MTLIRGADRRKRHFLSICAGAVILATLQGCGSSGSIAATQPGTVPGTPTAPTTSPGTPTAPDTATPTSPSAPDTAPATTTAPSAPAAPGNGGWTPQGQLANPDPIDRVVQADQTVVATWPKGAQAGHALVIKLKATRSGAKVVIHMNAANDSGKKVILGDGVFTNGVVADAQGNSLNADNFDPLWTLGPAAGHDGSIPAGQPLAGDIAVDAPASGTTLNMYWSQVFGLGGIILIRDIPITG
jgi:hypothetical protein